MAIKESLDLPVDVSGLRKAAAAARALDAALSAAEKHDLDKIGAGLAKVSAGGGGGGRRGPTEEQAAAKAAAAAARQQAAEERAAAKVARDAAREKATEQRAAAKASRDAARQAAADEKAAARAAVAAAREKAREEKAAAKVARDSAREKAREEKVAAREAAKKKRAEEQEQTRLKRIREGSGKGIGAVDIAIGNILSEIPGYLARAAAAAAELLKQGAIAVVQAAAFRQSTEKAFGVILKSASAGKQAYQQGLKLANELGLNAQETLGGLNNLLARGFQVDGATGAIAVLKAMADLKAISPDVNTDAMVTAIAQIKSKGKLQLEELQGQLGESFDVGAVLEQLSKKLHKSQNEIRALISAGKIDANTGILAVLDAIQAKTGKGLGGAAKDASRTFAGLFARLQNFPTNFLLGLDVSPGMGKVAAFLSNILDLLDPTTERGKRAGKAIESIASAFGDFFTSKAATEAVTHSLDLLIATGEGVAKGFQQVKPAVDSFFGALAKLTGTKDAESTARALGEAAAYAAVGFAALAGAVAAAMYPVVAFVVEATKLIDELNSLTAPASSAGQAIGNGFVSGLLNAMTGGLAGIYQAGAQLAGAAESGARTASETHSPSRAWERLARDWGEGGVRGMRRVSERLENASGNVAFAAARAASGAAANDNAGASGRIAAAGASSGGRGPVVINVAIDGATLAAAGVSRDKAREIGSQIGDAAIDAYFRRIAEAA